MKFRQISFKSFQKSRNKKKKTKEAQPEYQNTQTTSVDDNANLASIPVDSSEYFETTQAQDLSLRCSLRRFKTSVTPRSKYVINRRTAVSDDEDDDIGSSLQYELDDIDKVLNSGRKERTRIKTNPWIPQRKSLHEDQILDCVPEGATTEDYLNVCILAEEAGKSYHTSENKDNTKTSCARQLDLKELNTNRWSIISEGDVSIDLNSPTIEELNERFSQIDYQVDFKYEENIDNVLDDEREAKLAKRLSVNDLLEDYSEESTDLSNSSMEISDSTSCTGSVSSEESTESQLPSGFTKLFNCDNHMEDSIDAGYSSLSRDSRFPSTSDSDNTEHSDEEETDTTLVHANLNDCVSVGACVNCESARTLPDITTSLQEKVNQLRAEKLIVEEKIREAQEDDVIRMKETQRFRRYLPVYKKQVLLKTLNNLKERLENQSQRLQKSYTTVLSMQRKFSQRHNPFFLVPNTNFH